METMDALETRFDRALQRTARAWRLALGRRLHHGDLSQAAWQTVAMVGAAAAPLSQARLAQLLGVEGATMTAMLDRLVRAGLLLREASATDRRIKLVRLTTAGAGLFHQIKHEAQALRLAFLSQLDQDALLAATAMLEALQHALIDETDDGLAGATR